MDFSTIWIQMLRDTIAQGHSVAPRGRETLECAHRTIHVPMRKPVLQVPARKLNYRFMAAEAYWILTGDDRVETIAPYNANIAQFSDDGVRFFGAYGPKLLDQLMYVTQTLRADPTSRQAGLTFWRECPLPTKDVPCTIAMFFSIRGQYLHAHVFMRSSDIWLGVPYDVFNFSMIGHLICAHLNAERTPVTYLQPGMLFLTAASSHLYITNLTAAQECSKITCTPFQHTTPRGLWSESDTLLEVLQHLRESRPGDPLRWWEFEEEEEEA